MANEKDSAQVKDRQWTRRDLLRGAGAMAVLSPLHAAIAAADGMKPPAFAYVAASNDRQGSIHVFSVGNGKWSRVQRIAAHAPSHLLLSHTQRTLYVANDVGTYMGLPRGTVEAFAIDPFDGRLTLLGRQPLSLSATHPRALALSPDGKLLAVAAYGGGLLNLLPIASDGSLGSPVHRFKQTGSGPHARLQSSAHPHTLLFDDASQSLIASDFGSDHLSSFSLQRRKLKRHAQFNTGSGSGPASCVLHSATATLFVWHALEGALVAYRYDGANAKIGEVVQRVSMGKPHADSASAALALHASGSVLYAGHAEEGTIIAWKINAQSGRLSRMRSVAAGGGPIHLVAAPDGESLLIVTGNSIYRTNTDAVTGAPGATERVAAVTNPRYMALKTL